MNGEIENSLTTLRDHPQDTNALDALQKFFSGQAPSGEALAALAQSIQHHREQGNWEVTVRLIDLQLPLLSESDRRAEALALKGHICEYELLDERAALDAFEHALALRPDDEATRETLEHITLLRENWARVAQKYVEEAEASTDRQLATSFYLSAAEVVWRNQPESPQVEEYLRRSLEVEPRNRKASAHLERLLRRDRRFQEVAKLLEQRADVAAGNEERLAALLAAGELWSSELDNPAEAEGRYRRALALQPGDTAALTKLVNQLTRQESWPALVRLYEEALRGRPAPEQEAGILLQIGLLLDRKLGQPEQAEEYFRRVRKLDPTHPLMLDFYRGYHRQRGESAKTLALLDAAARMEADPEKRLALAREMAATAEEAGNLEKAIDLWKSIQRAAPAVGEPILALKRLYRQTQPPKWNALRELLKDEIDKLGEEQAEEKIRLLLEVVEIYRDHLRLDVMVINTYNAILALRPDHEEAIEALAQKYEAMGRWNDLIGLLMRRKEVQPGAARKVETLRRVASLWIEKFGNQSQAIKPLEEILEIDARDANAIAALREIHTRRRNWRELMELLRMEAASSDQERRRQLYKEMASLAADKLGDAREGIQVWNHVLEQDPRDREALAELAALYRREERWPALAEVLHRQAAAAESSEEQLSILEALGDIYTNRLRAVENAIHAWREVLAIRPDAPKARVVLRELYVQEQRWDELDALYRSRGELAELCETLAAAADRASDRELKIRLFTKVGAIWAENLESPDRGTKAYERVLAIDPQNPAAARALVTLYRGAEKWARLLATYEILLGHAVALEEKLGLLAEIRELCEQQLGSKNLSFAWCTRAFELAPDLPELRRELERLAAEADAWEELVGILGRRLEQVSEIEPRAQLLRDLASLCMERIRRPELAEGYYRQLLELDPKDEGTLESLQQIYSSTQRWPELVEIYRRRVQLEPAVEQQVDLLFKVAFLEEERRGDPVAAIDALREVCALDAGNLRALRMLDRLYQVRSEWSALAGVLKRQLELEPDREAKVELLFRLGTLHKSHLEEHGAAIDVFAQVLGLDPVHRATVLALEGYLDAGEAAEATRVAALLQPYYERIEDWARLARVLSTLLEAEDAREPRIALLKRLFGIHSRRLDHPEAAFAAGSSLLALDPADADNRHEMSTLGERLGRTDELAGLFVDALGGLTPGASPEVERAIAWELAVILDERLGRPGEAERYLRRVIALDPARRDAFDALERILRDDGKWNELRELLEQRKELAQAPALRRDILVQISALNEDVLGDDAAAVRSYEEILQIDPSHPMSLRALERHYAASGRWQDLIDLLRREMDFAPDDTTLNELKLRQAELLAEHIRDAVAAVDLLEEVASLDPNLQAAVDLLERLMIEQTELRRRITEILEPVYERRETYRDLSRILLVRRALAADRFEAVELLRRTAGLLEEQLRAPEEALPLYIEALLLEPGTPALQDAVDRLTGELSAWQGAAGAWQGAAAAADPADIALRGNLLRRLARVFDEKLADPLQARQTYEQLLELDPNNPQTAHPAVEALARLYQAADLSAELIQVLQRKLGWSDDRQERQELRIRIATIQEEKLGQREAAVASYHELLEENPSASPALDALERIYLAGSQWRELIDILRRRVALATSPEARRSHWLRIATIRESELHDLEEATAAYLALLGDLPNDLEALRALARIYRLGERWPDLLEMLERELPLCEENEQRIAVLFEAATLQHRQLSAPAAAVERYREVLVQRPDHNGARSALEELLADPDLRPTAAQVLAPIYEAENSWEKLVQVLQIKVEGAESASARVPLLKRIAALCEDGMGDLERAFEAWRRAAIEAATEPGMLDLVRELERVGRALDRHAELAAALEAIIAEVPDPQVQRDLHLRCAAICQDRLADLERARGHFQAVLDSDPENRTALEALDGLYTTLESWSSLQEILTRRVELAPDDVARRDLLLRSAAVWRDRLGQSDEAIADYEQVLGLFANEPSAIEALDALYTATERWSSLAELLDRRLALTESRDEQIALNYRLGELRAWKMSDPPGAIAAYQTVLQLDGSHGPAVAALEAYLDDVELRVEAARVLEVIYVGRQDWPRLIRIYQIRLDSAEEPERRLWLSTRIAQLYEEQLEDLEGAFTWYGKVFLEKPSDGGIRDQLLRLAGILERWSELAAILSQLLEQTLEENETTREVALLLGSIFDERLGEVERATACYRRPLESNRDDEEAFQRLESLLTRYDRWQELLKHYQDAADAATAPPARRELLLKVCRVWEEALENLPEAIDAYRAVLDLDEHDQVPVEALDRLYNETGRWQDLADLLARRAELAESEADQVAIKQRLATIFELRVQDLPTAIDLYDEVLTRDPKHLPAVAALERLILERDQRFRISQILEPIYRRQDEWAKLVVIYDAQLDFIEDPERRQFLFREIARLHEERDGSLELAFRAIARAFLEDPGDAKLLEESERLAEKLGGWSDLVQVLTKASEGLYDFALLARLGSKIAEIQEQRLDDRNAAVDAWRRVLGAQEDHEAAISALVRLYEILGRHEELIEILTRRAELTQDPEQRKPTYYRIAEIYELLLGRTERAIDTYRQVLALDESDRVTLGALERLYLAAGTWIDLIWIYRRKIEISTEAADRRALQRQVATVYEEKLQDRFEAIAAYKVLYQETPDDPQVLEALDRLFTAEELHSDLLEVLEVKIRLEQDQEKRLGLLCRAAEIQESEIGDLDGAIDRYRQVIETEVGNARARTALERLVRSSEAHRMLVSEILEAVYLKQSESLPLCEVLELRLEGIGEPDGRRDLLLRIARIAEEGLADDRRAFAALGRALTDDPAHADVQREIDRVAAKIGALGELVQVYEDRLGGIYDPVLLRSIHLKVAALLEHDLKDDKRAIEHYRAALEGGGDELEPLRALDRVYERQGLWPELLEVIGREIQTVADASAQATFCFRMGQVQQRRGDLDAAFGSYRDALERDPAHAGARAGMEGLLGEEAYRTAALDVLEPIAEAGGEHAKLVQLLEVRLGTIEGASERAALLERIAALQQEKLGSPAEALGALGRAIAEEPGSSRVLEAAEKLAGELGRHRELAALGEEVLGGELPAEAVRELGLRCARWCGELLNDVERSERIYRKVLEVDPECVPAMESLERIYRVSARDGELCNLLAKRAEVEPDARRKQALHAEIAGIRERSLGDLPGAIAAWRSAIEVDSQNLEALVALSGLLQKTEAWSEYLEVLERRGSLLDSASERIALKYEAGEVLVGRLGDTENAIEVYKDILDLSPVETRAIDALEAIYAGQESWAPLQELLVRRLDNRSGRDRIPVLLQLAEVAGEKLGNLEDAAGYYGQVLAEDGEHLEAMGSLERLHREASKWYDLVDVLKRHAEVLARRGDTAGEVEQLVQAARIWNDSLQNPESAAELLEEILRRDASNVNALAGLARIYETTRRWDKCREVLERAAALGPAPREAAELEFRMGRVKIEESGDEAAAVAHFGRAIELDANHGEAAAALEDWCRKQKDWGRLAGLLERRVERAEEAGDRLAILRELGTLYADRLGQADRGVEALERARQIAPDATDVLTALADAYFAATKLDLAAPLIQKLIDLAGKKRGKELAQLTYRLGAIAEKRGDPAAAREHYDQAYKMDSTFGPTLVALGRIYVGLQDWQNVRKLFRSMLLQNMDESSGITKAEIFYRLGQSHAELGEKSKAITMFERGLEVDAAHAGLREALAKVKA